jgi:sugar-specific transcriptional regulator TrmB
MELAAQLRSAGLHKQEIDVYLYLLAQGESAPPAIARGAGLLRPNTYAVLGTLRDKGLIERHQMGKRFVYLAKDPAAILRRMDEQRDTLAATLPDLRALYKSQKNKPSVRFYYGMDEVKEMFSRTEKASEILFVATSAKLFDAYAAHFKRYRESLMQEQVFVRDILTQQSGISIAQATRTAMRGYYDARFLPHKYEDVPTSIRLWNNNVGLATFSEPVTGTVITNDDLAKTFKSMFETMWLAAEKLN